MSYPSDTTLRRVFDTDPVIIIIGQSGCGKGTQVALFKQKYAELYPDKTLYISETGELLRNAIPRFSPFNKNRLNKLQSAGKLQSWVNVVALTVYKFLMEYTDGPVLIDGSPRSLGEAIAVIEFFRGYADKNIIVFYLALSDAEAEKRLISRNEKAAQENQPIRIDCSTPEKRKQKLSFFHTAVVPGLEHMRSQKGVQFHTLDATLPIEEIHTYMFRILGEQAF